MPKKEIIEAVSIDLGMAAVEARPIVQSILDTVLETLAAEGRLELRNFGVFEVQHGPPTRLAIPGRARGSTSRKSTSSRSSRGWSCSSDSPRAASARSDVQSRLGRGGELGVRPREQP